ncbi:MAG: hypothetical protein IJO85_06790 [Lachnospiraceae bacterium]|nr:hypothetical protein [Lachnospiraceae bacterium]
MKIELLNYTPISIAEFLIALDKNLPNNICLSPITLSLSFLDIQIDCDNKMTVINYDYLADTGLPAEFELEDANMLYDDLEWNNEFIKVNGEIFHLEKVFVNTPK